MKSYIVLRRVFHDNVLYLPGDEITLPQEQASELISVGAIREA